MSSTAPAVVAAAVAESPREVVRYTPYGAGRDLFFCRDFEVCLDGPAGTAKTTAALNKVHLAALKYPGMRALVARKTNVDLAASALVTYQTKVLHPGDGVEYFGGNKVKPAAFHYPNGSEIVVTGLDRPEKVKSAEYDMAYLNEATECDLEDLEVVRSRMRNGVMPYQQIILDTNPDAPMHWLNLRMEAGLTTRLLAQHEDNPRYYDHETGTWTEDGDHYINVVLGGLTGVREQRLRYGKWVAAEGMVYDAWNRKLHLVSGHELGWSLGGPDQRYLPPASWPRYLAIDFGFTNPFVCAWWAVDPDGRLYRYREIYFTHRLVADHAAEIKRLHGSEPLPYAIICDSEDAEGRATISQVTGWGTYAANKTLRMGIQVVAQRLRPAGDDNPRIFFVQGALVERDPLLEAAKKPLCTEQEFEGYIWNTANNRAKGEEPIDKDNHGLDQTRYMVAYLDLGESGAWSMPSLYG